MTASSMFGKFSMILKRKTYGTGVYSSMILTVVGVVVRDERPE
jgi:hypothetical protein